MADSTLDAMTEDTAPLDTDLMYFEHDPSGTPANRKVQQGNLLNTYTVDVFNVANYV